MRRIRGYAIVCLAVIMIVMMAWPAYAWQVRGAEDQAAAYQKVNTGEVIDDDLIIAGTEVKMEGTVQGDLIIFAQNAEVSGRVEGDLIVFSSYVNLTGQVAGNVRGAAQDFRISGLIGKNFTAAANRIVVESSGHVFKNASIAGESLSMNGLIDGRLDGAFSSAAINSQVGRDTRLTVNNLELGPAARLGGELQYTSANELKKDPAALVSGSTLRIEPPAQPAEQTPPASTGSSIPGILFSIIAGFIMWLAWWFISPASFSSLQQSLNEKPGVSFGLGLACLFGIPVAGIICLITIVGFPLSMLALLFYISVLIIGYVVASFYIGGLVAQFSKQEKLAHPAVKLLVGLVIFEILAAIPFIGFLVSVSAVALAFGAIIMALYTRHSRPGNSDYLDYSDSPEDQEPAEKESVNLDEEITVAPADSE